MTNHQHLSLVASLCLLGISGCGDTSSDPVFTQDGGSAHPTGGASSTGGTTGASGGSVSGGASSGTGGTSTGSGGVSTGSGGGGQSGSSAGGADSDAGASGGSTAGDGGSGTEAGVEPTCDSVHPLVNGDVRSCEPDRCYCPSRDACFLVASASSCCANEVVCDPGSELPVATINHPGDQETRAANVPIPFSGVGNDPQDGQLTGASMVWTSDRLSAPLGTGSSFDAALPAGTHLITLTVTDSDSNTGTDTITLIIQ